MKLLAHLPAFEMQDVRPGSIVLATLCLFAAVGISLLLVGGILFWLRPDDRAVAPMETRQLRAGARLEIEPAQDARRLKQAALQRLQGYGWTDRKTGEAHIPISRAIALLAKQGWPDADNQGAKR